MSDNVGDEGGRWSFSKGEIGDFVGNEGCDEDEKG